VTFKQKVAAMFPTVRSLTLLVFAILALGYNNDPERDFVVGVLVLVFGGLAIVSIVLTPTTKGAA